MSLYTKYRPSSWAEYVGQPKALAMVRRIIDAPGFTRGAFWIDCGGEHNSGVGKTTLARLIAAELASELFVETLSGADLSRERVRAIRDASHLCAYGKRGFRVWIINEAHAIGQAAIDLLLPLLEDLPPRCAVIFTTTRQPDAGLFGDDDGPLLSRCHRVRLTNQGLAEAFARRAAEIAKAEGLDGQADAAYLALARRCRNNFRRMLQEIESGAMLPPGKD